MNKTISICVAGPTSMALEDWLQWEQVVGQIASEQKMTITHSSVVRGATRFKKFSKYKPLSRTKGSIHRYSMASVPEPFITVIQDARLYAQRADDGVFLIIAAGRARPEEFVRRNLDRLKRCVSKVDGLAAFVLPRTELAANYVDGMNDVRECTKAKILVYESGGFLPP